MKKLLLILCIVAYVGSSHAHLTNPVTSHLAIAALAWSETTYDFGKIKVSVPVTHQFVFTNKGSEPIIVTSVKASCGCTVADYSKDPILPGQKGFVKATFNAAQAGIFKKTVTVHANVEGSPIQLMIQGEVVNN